MKVENYLKATAITKKSNNSDLDQFSRGGGDENYSNSGCILKAEPKGFSTVLRCQLEVFYQLTDLENPGGEPY